MTTKKRGRPVGSKNKPNTKIIKQPQIASFQKQLQEWDEQESKVNFKELCEKLQEALAKSYVETDGLKKTIENLNRELHARDIIITYLEIRKV
jgi:molecular chaperone DnaK (HSP70)